MSRVDRQFIRFGDPQGSFSGRIVGVSSPGTINRAHRLGRRRRRTRHFPQKVAGEADLIPAPNQFFRFADSLAELNRWVRPDALITDAGST